MKYESSHCLYNYPEKSLCTNTTASTMAGLVAADETTGWPNSISAVYRLPHI